MIVRARERLRYKHDPTFEYRCAITLVAQFKLSVIIILFIVYLIDLSRRRGRCASVLLTLTDTLMKSCVECVRVSRNNNSDQWNVKVFYLDSPYNAVAE